MSTRYKRIWVNGKEMAEHRYVMEQYLGRKLLPDEVVHHINGDRYDNRIENLQVMSAAEHLSLHHRKYPLTANCVICGKEFTPCHTSRRNPKTCSNECWHKYHDLIAKKRRKPIAQYDMDGNLVKIWESGMELRTASDFTAENIYKCCKHKRKHAGGFQWEYAEVDNEIS